MTSWFHQFGISLYMFSLVEGKSLLSSLKSSIRSGSSDGFILIYTSPRKEKADVNRDFLRKSIAACKILKLDDVKFSFK